MLPASVFKWLPAVRLKIDATAINERDFLPVGDLPKLTYHI